MIETLLTQDQPPQPLWLNLKNPSQEEMEDLSKKYNLHPEMVYDCLGPFHLPKHEVHNNTTFIIIRAYDENSLPDEDTVQGMTKKIALFLGNRFLITFHRLEHKFLRDLSRDYQEKKEKDIYLQKLTLELLQGAVETYQKPLEEMEELCQKFESAILHDQATLKWVEVFRTKSRLMTIKRMLWHTQNTVYKFMPYNETHLPLYQDLKEQIESLIFLTETLSDDLANLLNIQMSLASQKTNDVMRVLTVFSVFFMPLTFIVGIYGMNFEFMPELKHPMGYFVVWLAMITITIAIYFWFRKKKWL